MSNEYTNLSDMGIKGAKRVEEVTLLVNSFYQITKNVSFREKFGVETVSLKDDSPQIICDIYYKNLKKYKSFMNPKDGEQDIRVNRYKIISGLEIAVCETQPFITDTNDNTILVNSYFAVFVAVAILMAWEDGADYLLDYAFPNLDPTEQKEIHRLLIEHIDWLSLIKNDSNHLHYFSNAQTWWAIRMLLRELNETRI